MSIAGSFTMFVFNMSLQCLSSGKRLRAELTKQGSRLESLHLPGFELNGMVLQGMTLQGLEGDSLSFDFVCL